jgi:hypothetical protein
MQKVCYPLPAGVEKIAADPNKFGEPVHHANLRFVFFGCVFSGGQANAFVRMSQNCGGCWRVTALGKA